MLKQKQALETIHSWPSFQAKKVQYKAFPRLVIVFEDLSAMSHFLTVEINTFSGELVHTERSLGTKELMCVFSLRHPLPPQGLWA